MPSPALLPSSGNVPTSEEHEPLGISVSEADRAALLLGGRCTEDGYMVLLHGPRHRRKALQWSDGVSAALDYDHRSPVESYDADIEAMDRGSRLEMSAWIPSAVPSGAMYGARWRR